LPSSQIFISIDFGLDWQQFVSFGKQFVSFGKQFVSFGQQDGGFGQHLLSL
jgi:hypothetical protein